MSPAIVAVKFVTTDGPPIQSPAEPAFRAEGRTPVVGPGIQAGIVTVVQVAEHPDHGTPF